MGAKRKSFGNAVQVILSNLFYLLVTTGARYASPLVKKDVFNDAKLESEATPEPIVDEKQNDLDSSRSLSRDGESLSGAPNSLLNDEPSISDACRSSPISSTDVFRGLSSLASETGDLEREKMESLWNIPQKIIHTKQSAQLRAAQLRNCQKLQV